MEIPFINVEKYLKFFEIYVQLKRFNRPNPKPIPTIIIIGKNNSQKNSNENNLNQSKLLLKYIVIFMQEY